MLGLIQCFDKLSELSCVCGVRFQCPTAAFLANTRLDWLVPWWELGMKQYRFMNFLPVKHFSYFLKFWMLITSSDRANQISEAVPVKMLHWRRVFSGLEEFTSWPNTRSKQLIAECSMYDLFLQSLLNVFASCLFEIVTDFTTNSDTGKHYLISDPRNSRFRIHDVVCNILIYFYSITDVIDDFSFTKNCHGACLLA